MRSLLIFVSCLLLLFSKTFASLNVLQGAHTRSSPIARGGEPSRAVDGNSAQYHDRSSCFYTAAVNQGDWLWW